MVILRGWNGYALSLTLYPSFTLSLLTLNGNYYIKYLGICKGLKLSNHVDGVYFSGQCDLEYVKELCGIFKDPLDIVNEVELRYVDTYYYLMSQWRGLGLSTACGDPDYLFISIYLSKRTSYHRNVLHWVREISKIVKNINELAELDTSKLFKQPQLRSLGTAFKQYLELVKPKLGKGHVEEVKMNLMSIKGVGPKITYAFMLHAMRITELAPADTHLIYFVTNVMGLHLKPPKKELCLRYDCYECNLNCIVGYLRMNFGRALGYFQTATYIHVKELCKKILCSNCILRKRCLRTLLTYSHTMRGT